MPNENNSTSSPPETDDQRKEALAVGEADFLPAEAIEQLKRRGVDVDDPKIRRVVSTTVSLIHVGPLPLPTILAGYDQVRPGTTDKIIEWAERQINHRIGLESETTKRAEGRMDRGQFMAVAVALGGLCIAGIVGIYGSAFAASVIAAVSVGGPTAAVALTRFMNATPGRDSRTNAK